MPYSSVEYVDVFRYGTTLKERVFWQRPAGAAPGGHDCAPGGSSRGSPFALGTSNADAPHAVT